MRNSNTNHTNVTLNSTSRGCKAEPYPFSASAVIQSLFKFNKLGYGNACQGLRHWRLLSNLKNNFLKPVRNDMDNKNRPDCFAFARNDAIVKFEDNERTKILKQVQNDNVTRHPAGDNPKDLSTQSHVITRNNVKQEVQNSIQSDVVIPNELGNDETCQGLLRRFVHKFTSDNEISPHNDMNNKILKQLTATPTHTDSHVSPQLNGSLCITGREGKEKRKGLINLSTYQLIDFKEILRLKPQDDEKM